MSSRRKVVLLTILTLIILLMGIGTYSFFTADLSGNPDNKNIVQTIGTLKIEYTEGQNIDADGIRPGWSGTKTFTVKNTGTIIVDYDIVFQDLINTFINNEIVFNGTCSSHPNSCDSITQSSIPETEYFIKQNINIEPNEQHNYTIDFEFIETNTNQDYNLYAKLSGKISIYETNTYVPQPNIAVDIVDNMIPITWETNKWVKTNIENNNNEWYDYEN